MIKSSCSSLVALFLRTTPTAMALPTRYAPATATVLAAAAHPRVKFSLGKTRRSSWLGHYLSTYVPGRSEIA